MTRAQDILAHLTLHAPSLIDAFIERAIVCRPFMVTETTVNDLALRYLDEVKPFLRAPHWAEQDVPEPRCACDDDGTKRSSRWFPPLKSLHPLPV